LEDVVSEAPIGIFDSGVGGLTVVKALLSAIPCEKIVYFGDTARVPYGIRSSQTIRRYALQDANFLLRFKPKLIIAACNTVSSTALDDLKEKVDVPIIGVIEPGALAAVKSSKTGRIGVIGTEATIESRAYERAIAKMRPDAKIIAKACPLFVPMVEEGRVTGPVAEAVVRDYIEGLLPVGVDTLVLGCTHYPALKDVIRKVTGNALTIVDSAEETANAVRAILEIQHMSTPARSGSVEFFASDNPGRFRRLAALFLGAMPCGVTLVEPEDFLSGVS
jgi:glutamate racemase